MSTKAAVRSVRVSTPRPAGSPPRRPGRPTLSNEELLDKALDLFLEQGFERTSIDAISAAAGVAKRTVYQRYADKEGLFKAALQRAIDDWIIPLEELYAAECDDLEETLLNVGRILVSNIMRPAGLRLLRITNAESVRTPEIGAYTYQQGTGRTLEYLAELLQRRIAPEETDAAYWNKAAIAYLYLVVCGPPTMTAWGMAFDDAEIVAHTTFGVHIFLHGLVERSRTAPVQTARPSPDDVIPPNSLPKKPAPALAQNDKLTGLQDENRRLRALLISSMLETATLREDYATR